MIFLNSQSIFLRNIDQMSHIFYMFRIHIGHLLDYKIKFLQMDGIHEFLSSQFKHELKMNGIRYCISCLKYPLTK